MLLLKTLRRTIETIELYAKSGNIKFIFICYSNVTFLKDGLFQDIFYTFKHFHLYKFYGKIYPRRPYKIENEKEFLLYQIGQRINTPAGDWECTEASIDTFGKNKTQNHYYLFRPIKKSGKLGAARWTICGQASDLRHNKTRG